MMALMASTPVLVTKTFTTNDTFTVPYGVSSLVSASGYGARGTSTLVHRYNKTTVVYFTRRDGGPTERYISSSDTILGAMPSNYCDPANPTPDDPTYSSTQTCYEFSDSSFTSTTTGASATGFGQTFPGSTGNAQPATATFSNISVAQGQAYSIVVPSGGSITITYYQ